jgi:hypothetical protein
MASKGSRLKTLSLLLCLICSTASAELLAVVRPVEKGWEVGIVCLHEGRAIDLVDAPAGFQYDGHHIARDLTTIDKTVFVTLPNDRIFRPALIQAPYHLRMRIRVKTPHGFEEVTIRDTSR